MLRGCYEETAHLEFSLNRTGRRDVTDAASLPLSQAAKGHFTSYMLCRTVPCRVRSGVKEPLVKHVRMFLFKRLATVCEIHVHN